MARRLKALSRAVAHRRLRAVRGAVLAVLAVWVAMAGASPSPQDQVAPQRAQYDADVPKTILELQPFRTQTQVAIDTAAGVAGTATLVDLNPDINAWYLLTLQWPGAAQPLQYHLESPRRRELRLRPGDPHAVRIDTADGAPCIVWSSDAVNALNAALDSRLPYAPLCAGTLYLRNVVSGYRTTLARVTDFLRDHVWGGEQVITFIKEEVYRDAFRESGVSAPAASAPGPSVAPMPQAAAVAPESESRGIIPEHLALDVSAAGPALQPGAWYAVRDLDGVAASVITPASLAAPFASGREAHVNGLDTVEAAALVYLVAFDLQRFELHFVLGTDHPRVDWSSRPPASVIDPRLPGPDGIGSIAPLVATGMVSPADVPRTIGTFAGGFKRVHGAFRFGALAERNHGSHYGFIEQGVILSKLQPGLATVLALDDGRVDLKTWSAGDQSLLPHVRYARQNGVPLIEYDPARALGVPGDLVSSWGPGNWSGSATEDLRTVRAGLCLQGSGVQRFLIYGYFSAATPSAMARVFQAYGCRYAMHLDMNAPEHAYLALYVHRGHQYVVEHLIPDMQEVDRSIAGEPVPRFLGYPDDRDFFYLTRRADIR